ncbi:MAG: M23 family metallopeptidase [Rikenellaceae bacterium]|nr:M23 family metallopeptidase [Rikenellaceae bacterium]
MGRDKRRISAWFGLACLLAGVHTAAAQPGYYRQPMDHTPALSANFGEMRPGHFHSGIDLKTEGVTGKRVRAAADGYISRIAVQPGGYGRALYVTHPNGTTTVYGHLLDFADEVEQAVRDEQYRRRSFTVELFPDASQFPVRQGDVIARSGNSGSSGGPHLHFEVRETASQKPVNVLARGLLKVTDNIPPYVVKLHVIGVDTVQGVPVHTVRRTLGVQRTAAGTYRLADTTALRIGPATYFGVEVAERKNGVTNPMGTYRIQEKVDGQVVFELANDGFLFSQTRYVNAAALYAENLKTRNDVFRLVRLPNNKLPIYTAVRRKGIVTPADSSRHRVEIMAEDDSGNASVLAFTVRLGDAPRPPEAPEGAVPVLWYRDKTIEDGGMRVTLPANALYESILFTSQIGPRRPDSFSPVYRVHEKDVPLQGSYTLSLEAGDIEPRLRGKVLLAEVNDKGIAGAAGGRWTNGRVEGRLRSFGRYCIVADTVPPGIVPSFKSGADLSATATLSFTIGDNLSGIDRYEVLIDGQWALFEYDPKNRRITHRFAHSPVKATGGVHTIEATVTDGVGNVARYKGRFVR